MNEISEAESIARARAALRFEPAVPAQAWHTRRLDRPGQAYYLVVFGARDASIGIATVDAASGELQSSAPLPGTASHISVDAERARALAGADEGAHTEFVWLPSQATRSPLYPLWAVVTKTGTVYVDQQGTIWPSPGPLTRGG